MSFVEVQEALAEVMAEDTERTKLSVDAIIAETASIAFVNMFDYMRIGENGEPYVDLSALTRAQAAGLLSFKYKEHPEGRGEDSRDVAEVEIRINPGKLTALVKLGERVGAWKPQSEDSAGITLEQMIADDKARVQKLEELARVRFGPPNPEEEKAQ